MSGGGDGGGGGGDDGSLLNNVTERSKTHIHTNVPAQPEPPFMSDPRMSTLSVHARDPTFTVFGHIDLFLPHRM